MSTPGEHPAEVRRYRADLEARDKVLDLRFDDRQAYSKMKATNQDSRAIPLISMVQGDRWVCAMATQW
jgi:hypothetical protein